MIHFQFGLRAFERWISHVGPFQMRVDPPVYWSPFFR